MELFSPQFFSALLAIIVIDLVLAGDNAIVIALAARKLPQHLQMKAVMWGTAGAIAVRVAMTLIVVALLRIPGLMLAGGVLLVWIAYKLLAEDDEGEHGGTEGGKITGFWSAIRTIVIADTVMGLDNVLGVAGAAGGSFLLVVIGLLISIPIMVWGSTLILRIVDRYPAIIYIGAGVLAWTAAKMILHEPLVQARIEGMPWVPWLLYAVIIGGVLGVGWRRNRGPKPAGVVLPEDASAKARDSSPPG
jgi:YjbE family integral membrane protein